MKQTAVLALSALVLAVSATVWIDVPAQRLTDSRLASLDQVIDVSVFPKDKNRDVVLTELLATELPGFSLKEKTSCWALGDALVATPEIRRILEANRMTYSAGYIGGFYIQQLGQHFTLNVSQMTLKSTLDKVVKESPVAKIWIVKRDSSEETLLLRLNARLENAPKNNLKGDFLEIGTDELPD